MYKSVIQRIKPLHALLALIVVNILTALLIGRTFGESWDETIYYIYGEKSLDAYLRGLAGLPLIPEKHLLLANLRFYGPFYAVLGKVTTDTLLKILSGWSYENLWHLVNFIFFQIALIGLYIIAKRFMREWTAVAVTFLLATQPLLFGHAFINPKDIPFMSFFIASIAAGLIMVEAGIKKTATENSPRAVIAGALFGLYTLTIVCRDVIASLIGSVISFIYNASPNSLIGRIFSMFVDQANRRPIENYIHKAVNSRIDQIAILLLVLIIFSKWIFETYRSGSKLNLKLDLPYLIKILIAGTILGLTTSIRVLGPFAGVLIAGYALVMTGKKSIATLLIYFSIAAMVAYATWPFLWDSPVYHFINSLKVMKDFPFEGTIRFMGNDYVANKLPWSYIPILIAIQLTEPVAILSLIGLTGCAWTCLKSPSQNKNTLLILTWFLLPVGLFILLRSSAYDNFRQFFFVIPPLFIFSGIALEWIIERIKSNMWRSALLLLIAAPGILGIATWHPYEYIYYNSFVGGVTGAADSFETDYWMTSYREAANYLNENAPTGAKILVMYAGFNIEHNARKDLIVESYNPEKASQGGYDYAVISTRYDSHLTTLPEAEVVYEVRKNGVLLAVVKKLHK